LRRQEGRSISSCVLLRDGALASILHAHRRRAVGPRRPRHGWPPEARLSYPSKGVWREAKESEGRQRVLPAAPIPFGLVSRPFASRNAVPNERSGRAPLVRVDRVQWGQTRAGRGLRAISGAPLEAQAWAWLHLFARVPASPADAPSAPARTRSRSSGRTGRQRSRGGLCSPCMDAENPAGVVFGGTLIAR